MDKSLASQQREDELIQNTRLFRKRVNKEGKGHEEQTGPMKNGTVTEPNLSVSISTVNAKGLDTPT